MFKRRETWKVILVFVCLGISLFFFLIPGVRLVVDLTDPALRSGEIPQAAWRLEATLSPRYEKWANARLASKRAAQLGTDDVSGTEWPLFGSVFYLRSMESLQQAWERDHSLAPVAPAVSARGAIEAAANLVVDPNQAAWVKQYWGPDYLHKQDLFYRFLLISAMTSYTQLTGDRRMVPQLRDQVETLSAAIDASPHGLIDDYPGQCYPTDVIGAIGAIHRADSVLKTDHSAFVARALRGFQPPQASGDGLPPYVSNAHSGAPSDGYTRGCGVSFALINSPETWPSTADAWYKAYETDFWQKRMGLVGFREFPKDVPASQGFSDVDSGPVILGFGFAASAFGVGAARVNGRMDHAGPLTAEMLVSSWPFPTGTLLLPRLLSSATDAPYLGEAGILFCLTRQPVAGIRQSCPSVMTPFVWFMLLVYFGLGIRLAWPFVSFLGTYRRSRS